MCNVLSKLLFVLVRLILNVKAFQGKKRYGFRYNGALDINVCV